MKAYKEALKSGSATISAGYLEAKDIVPLSSKSLMDKSLEELVKSGKIDPGAARSGH